MLRAGVNGRVPLLVSLLLPFSCAVSLFLLLYIVFLSHLWGDQAFLMYAARQMLAGVPLDGSRLIETNPPMVVWFSVIPMLISERLHLLPDHALWGAVLAILSGSTAWSYRLLRKGNDGHISPVLLATLIGVSELVIRPALFGQKEQIAVALLMPFVIATATQAEVSIVERSAIGALAGIGVCFKPQQLLIVVALELYLQALQPSLKRLARPELIATCTSGAVYLFCVSHFTPYLTAIAPILQDTYWALGNRTFPQLLLHEGGPLTVGLILVIGVVLVLRNRIDVVLPGAFAACSAGATAAFYLQHTGWYYQAFPSKAFLTLAAAVLLLEWIAARLGQPLRFVRPPVTAWIMALVIASAAFGVAAFTAHQANARTHVATVDSVLETLPAGTPVYIFSIEMSQFRVVLDHNLVWGSRFAHLWMLPAIVQNQFPRRDVQRPFRGLGPERTEQLAMTLRSATAEDFGRWRPQYVFVEKCDGAFYCDIYNYPMNFVAWYSQDPIFVAQWNHYRFEKTVGKFDLYLRQ